MSEVFERVSKVVADKLSVPIAEVTTEKDFMNDLGADSLAVVDLVIGFEDEFKIQIPDEDANDIKTVGNATNYIKGRLAG